MTNNLEAAGILTAGGNCPGINDAIHGAVDRANEEGLRIVAIQKGYEGLLTNKDLPAIQESFPNGDARHLQRRPASILGLSRLNPMPMDDSELSQRNLEAIRRTMERNRMKFFIAIGGDDTLGAAHRLTENGILVNGVPKTIDNDIKGTDRTFGFETAVHVGRWMAEGMRGEAESYGRVSIIETMGRDAGWIALESGDRADADIILIPEVQVRKNALIQRLREVMEDKNQALVVVSEGFLINGKRTYRNQELDPHGNGQLGGIRDIIEGWLKQADMKIKVATQEIKYAHRFGEPTEEDAAFAWTLGHNAMDAALQGNYGVVAVERNEEKILVPFSEISGGRTVPPEFYDEELLKKRK